MKKYRITALLLLVCLLLGISAPSAASAEEWACPHEVVDHRVEPGRPASCTTEGFNYVVTYCTGCGAELSREMDIIPAGGQHVPGGRVTENYHERSCVSDGWYDLVVYCTSCGAELSREHVYMSAKGHQSAEPVEENRVEPAFGRPGSVDRVVYCSVCGEELSRETETLPASALFMQADELHTLHPVHKAGYDELGLILCRDYGLPAAIRQMSERYAQDPSTENGRLLMEMLTEQNKMLERGSMLIEMTMRESGGLFFNLEDQSGYPGYARYTFEFGKNSAGQRLDKYKVDLERGKVKYLGKTLADSEGTVKLNLRANPLLLLPHDDTISPPLLAARLQSELRQELEEESAAAGQEPAEQEPAAREPKTIWLYNETRADLSDLVSYDRGRFQNEPVFRFEGIDGASEELTALLLARDDIMEAVQSCDNGGGEDSYSFTLREGVSVSFTREGVKKLMSAARTRILYKPEEESAQEETVAEILEEIRQQEQQPQQRFEESPITITLVFTPVESRVRFEEQQAPGPSPKKFS